MLQRHQGNSRVFVAGGEKMVAVSAGRCGAKHPEKWDTEN